jgi:hypothetical protein
MICPVCQSQELVSQSLEDTIYPDLFCPTTINLGSGLGKIVNHFRIISWASMTRIIVMPYRIKIFSTRTEIDISSFYKTGHKKHFFKHLLNTVPIQPDTEEKLLARIKMLMVFQ